MGSIARPGSNRVHRRGCAGHAASGLLAHWRLTGSAAAADRLYAAIERNVPNPINEALWAATGTMVGALHMLEWTGERRWEALFLRNVEQLWRTWLASENAPCHLWTQHLYGEIVQLIGAGHGFAGNAYPLLRGAKLLPCEQRDTLYARCVETLAATAMVEADCGNLVWRAGPLEKGFGICHGTADNGYALLKLHQRTGDAVWLDRARAFAMHAIGQAQRTREQFGRGRYSLWTGEPGLAVYLQHCIEGTGGVPSLDVL